MIDAIKRIYTPYFTPKFQITPPQVGVAPLSRGIQLISPRGRLIHSMNDNHIRISGGHDVGTTTRTLITLGAYNQKVLKQIYLSQID